MAYVVFFATVQAEQLRAGHVESAPVCYPLNSVLRTIGLGKVGKNLSSVLVHFLKPVFCCLLVVSAVYSPILHQFQVILKLGQQVVSRHLPACEEIATHPICGVTRYEVIAQTSVGKDVGEKQPAWFEPTRNVLEEALVVFQMLEHLNRDYAVELTLCDVKGVDIASHDY